QIAGESEHGLATLQQHRLQLLRQSVAGQMRTDLSAAAEQARVAVEAVAFKAVEAEIAQHKLGHILIGIAEEQQLEYREQFRVEQLIDRLSGYKTNGFGGQLGIAVRRQAFRQNQVQLRPFQAGEAASRQTHVFQTDQPLLPAP